MPLQNGKEAKILQHFGDGICKMLDQRLERHYAEHGPNAPIHSLPSNHDTNRKQQRASTPPPTSYDPELDLPGAPQEGPSPTKKNTKGKKQREYVPQKRSGGYAVLLTLYKESKNPNSKGFMTKTELQREAQPLCDKSFTLTEPSNKYTAWSSVSTLIQKELVIKTHCPARYSLTDKGLHLAQRLEAAEEVLEGRNDSASQGCTTASEEDQEDQDKLHCRENIQNVLGAAHRKQELVSELKRNGVNFDVRKLHIGDFLWIAQEKVQPFRLKRCGLCHPIYLVEDYGSAQHLSIPESTLQQAIVNTQVVDGFFIKRTKDVRESAAYLTIMTRYLQTMYSNKTLLSCTKEEASKCDRVFHHHNQSCILIEFKDFNEGAMKNKAQTVKEVFARQLMQISGVSGEKATAILERYSTPASLLSAFECCTSTEEREKLLSNVKCGKLQRNLGPVLSKTISQLYCTKEALS
ncbi:hypothetical protein GDO78_003631 [Eleutherodactylus coqui]|uniref:Crossover junction endonuclease MUS81 n=1 Tax=Eleutherodactylus coqui TaxID=57060 RepID=A0A8J6EUP7_ELECQ|nr:hypothetical protein GDO78_003631 [Eleutherodactylus coqui]